MTLGSIQVRFAILILFFLAAIAHAEDIEPETRDLNMPKRLNEYFEQMSVAKPFVVRGGPAWSLHRNEIRKFVLDCAGLNPLPKRVPLDIRISEQLDHPWCTIRQVSYQLWPAVYSTGAKNKSAQKRAWERNGIVWGRPVAGMAVTDLQAVLDGIAARCDAAADRVSITCSGNGDLSIAALFTMILDSRVAEADLDFAGSCYEKRNLMLVPRILLHGDVLQWAAVVADRPVKLRNVPAEAGDAGWLRRIRQLARSGEKRCQNDLRCVVPVTTNAAVCPSFANLNRSDTFSVGPIAVLSESRTDISNWPAVAKRTSG